MRILLMSDSHRLRSFSNIVDFEQPDKLFHMGDSEFKLEELNMFDNVVRGNCDIDQKIPKVAISEIDSLRFFMTHGHLHGVNYGHNDIIDEAINNNCNVIVHGHTHVVFADIINKVLILNPGSIRQSRCSYPESYMLMNTDQDTITIELKSAANNSLLDTFCFKKGELC